jgi:hypothetical protein
MNMEGGWILELKSSFMNTTHEPLHLDKSSMVQHNIMNIPPAFIWTVILLNDTSEYGDGVKFWRYVEENSESLCVEFCNFV